MSWKLTGPLSKEERKPVGSRIIFILGEIDSVTSSFDFISKCVHQSHCWHHRCSYSYVYGEGGEQYRVGMGDR